MFACKTRTDQHVKATIVDTAVAGIYPADHNLTAEERKNFTEQFLKQKGIPTIGHLPFIEDFRTARFRDVSEVARKSVVLYGLIFVANKEKSSDEITAYFKKYGLWKDVSPDERTYLEKKDKTENDDNPFTWRLENLNVLLWALGHFDKLPFPTTLCDFSGYQNLPDLDNDPNTWINKAKLRSTEDILNETDLIYRVHWATEEARIHNKKAPANLNEDVIMERHFALNLLTMYADEWDEITTDT